MTTGFQHQSPNWTPSPRAAPRPQHGARFDEKAPAAEKRSFKPKG